MGFELSLKPARDVSETTTLRRTVTSLICLRDAQPHAEEVPPAWQGAPPDQSGVARGRQKVCRPGYAATTTGSIYRAATGFYHAVYDAQAK